MWESIEAISVRFSKNTLAYPRFTISRIFVLQGHSICSVPLPIRLKTLPCPVATSPPSLFTKFSGNAPVCLLTPFGRNSGNAQSILHLNLLLLNLWIRDKPVTLQIFGMHINACNLIVLISFIIIDSLIRIAT